jgi:hypothetical protein
MRATTWWVIGTLGAAGCATVTLPAESVARYEAAARSADELGGEGVPEAELHLKLARDEADAAQRLSSEGDARALTMIERAQADAELAVSLARQTKVRAEAAQADEQLRAIEGSPDTKVTP